MNDVRSHALALAIVLCLTALLAVAVLEQRPCDIDEPHWLTTSAVTMQLLRSLAGPSRWATAYDDAGLADWGNKNPPLAKAYFGLILWWTGHTSVQYRWQWDLTYDQNAQAGNLPPLSMLTPVRLGVVATAALVLWLLYWIAWRLTSSAWAIVAPLSLWSLPVFRFYATHVYTDMPQIALMLASGWLAIGYAERPIVRRAAGAAVLAGLACAVKFSAAQAVVALAIITASYAPSFRERVRDTAVAIVLPLLVFVVVNPYLYPSPVRRMLGVVADWRVSKAAQQADPALRPGAVTSRAMGVVLVAMRLAASQQRPFSAPAEGDREPWRWWPAAAVLLSVGGLSLRRRCAPTRAQAWLALAGTAFLLTALWLPFDWPRYYLPVMIWTPPLVVLAMMRASSSRWMPLRRAS